MFADSGAAQLCIEELARQGAQPTIARNYRMNGEDLARARGMGLVVNESDQIVGNASSYAAVTVDLGDVPPVLMVTFANAEATPCPQLAIAGLPASMEQASLVSLFTGLGFTVFRSAIKTDPRNQKFATARVLGAAEVLHGLVAAVGMRRIDGNLTRRPQFCEFGYQGLIFFYNGLGRDRQCDSVPTVML